jgi:hypothetical protein
MHPQSGHSLLNCTKRLLIAAQMVNYTCIRSRARAGCIDIECSLVAVQMVNLLMHLQSVQSLLCFTERSLIAVKMVIYKCIRNQAGASCIAPSAHCLLL